MLMFAANSSANVLQKGLYYKSGSGVIYAGERPNDLSFLSKDIAIKNENGDYLITLLTESSQKIAITVLKDKETVISSRDVGLIKKNNPNNAFIQNIKKMTVSDLTETEDSVRFSVNIYSSIDSVFSPEAAETKLSTDVVLTQSNSCSIQYYVCIIAITPSRSPIALFSITCEELLPTTICMYYMYLLWIPPQPAKHA